MALNATHVLSLWRLWQMILATEQVDCDDEAFTDRMWTDGAHRIVREFEYPNGAPDLSLPLGP